MSSRRAEMTILQRVVRAALVTVGLIAAVYVSFWLIYVARSNGAFASRSEQKAIAAAQRALDVSGGWLAPSLCNVRVNEGTYRVRVTHIIGWELLGPATYYGGHATIIVDPQFQVIALIPGE